MAETQIHEDIKWLESQLEAKKKELEGSGAEAKHEREIVKDVLRESTQNEAFSGPLVLPQNTSDDDVKKADELEEQKHEPVVEKLVEIAFTKNLAAALKAARSLNNPHLLDEFHDILADQYYEKLQNARKLQ